MSRAHQSYKTARDWSADSKNRPSLKYPLRKVVSHTIKNGVDFDVLECGHEIELSIDLSGINIRNRRRCLRCEPGT